MILLWLVSILIVSAIIIIVIVRLTSENSSDQNVLNKQIFSHQLKTGDILYVGYKNSLGKFMKVWSGSKWSHTAMVYRTPTDDLYVMETANYPDRKGVLFLPIAEWYRYNSKSDIAVSSLKTPEDFNRDSLLFKFSEVKDKKLDTFGISWLRLIANRPYESIANRQNITCYELIVHLLQESSIAEKSLSPSSYFPIDIIRGKLKLKDGFSYRPIEKFRM